MESTGDLNSVIIHDKMINWNLKVTDTAKKSAFFTLFISGILFMKILQLIHLDEFYQSLSIYVSQLCISLYFHNGFAILSTFH